MKVVSRSLLSCAALALIFLIHLALPAFAQRDAGEFKGIYGEVFNREYRDTPEGRQKLVNDIKVITLERGLLKYFPEFGISVSTLQEFTAISERYPAFEAISGKVDKFGILMSGTGLLFDLASGTRKDIVVVKSSLLVMANLLGRAGMGGIGVALTAGQLFMERAGNAMYDAYEQRWYQFYRHYYTEGERRLKYTEWADRLEQNTYRAYMNQFWDQENLMGLFRDYHGKDTKGFVGDALAFSDKSYREKFMARFFAEELKDSVSNIYRVRTEKRAQRELDEIRAELERLSRIGTLRVSVAESETGTPVAGASVKAVLGDPGKGAPAVERSAVTDSKGTADLQIPLVSYLTLHVAHKDYKSYETSLGRFEVSLDSRGRPVVMTGSAFLSRDKVPLDIQVKNSKDGSALKGAAIEAKAGGSSVSAVTSGNGRASLKVLPGNVEITVSMADYKSQSLSITVPAAGASRTVDLDPGLYGGRLTVTVRHKMTKAPLDGVTVTAAAGGETASDVTRGGKAELSFREVGRGNAAGITAAKEGFRTLTASKTFEGAKTASLLSASAMLEMEPDQAMLEVFVKDKDTDAPLAGVNVAVAGVAEHALTGEDGKARMAVPGKEKVSVTVSKDGYAGRTGEREVKDGVAKAAIYLQKSGATLSVMVGDKSSKRPLGGVKVKASVNGAETTVTTSTDGTAVLQIPAGKSVTIALSKQGYEDVQVTKPIIEGKASASGTLVPVAQLAITIRNKDTQKPVRGALVKAGTASGTTNAGGVCVLKVPPGTEVEMNASAEGYLPRQATGKTPAAGESRTIGWFLAPVAKQAGPAVKPASPAGKDPQHGYDGSYSPSLYDASGSATGTISFTIIKSNVQGSFSYTNEWVKGKKIAFAGTFGHDIRRAQCFKRSKCIAISVPVTSGHYGDKPFGKETYVIIRFEADGRMDGDLPGGAHFKNY
ncbi:MAG: carboxypeptidase-like regulatory domain-containing protein [Candidatus Eremiobacteraeota bacterium]|nr:carboxypeptidase-like regulatory domain-containing protein [Candidatus Eremiobacteraeota bacterium]